MKLLRTSQVVEKVGFSRQQIWRLEKRGLFPPRQKLACANITGWDEATIDQWLRDNLAPVGAGAANAGAEK